MAGMQPRRLPFPRRAVLGGPLPEARLREGLALEALAEGMLDSARLRAYEVRLRPEERRWPDWTLAQWCKVARTLDALEDGWDGPLAQPLDMGRVALACALGYLSFRHGAGGWRYSRPRLAGWEARKAERPSLAATRPG